MLAALVAVGALVLCAFARKGLGQVAGSRRSVEGAIQGPAGSPERRL